MDTGTHSESAHLYCSRSEHMPRGARTVKNRGTCFIFVHPLPYMQNFPDLIASPRFPAGKSERDDKPLIIPPLHLETLLATACQL